VLPNIQLAANAASLETDQPVPVIVLSLGPGRINVTLAPPVGVTLVSLQSLEIPEPSRVVQISAIGPLGAFCSVCSVVENGLTSFRWVDLIDPQVSVVTVLNISIAEMATAVVTLARTSTGVPTDNLGAPPASLFGISDNANLGAIALQRVSTGSYSSILLFPQSGTWAVGLDVAPSAPVTKVNVTVFPGMRAANRQNTLVVHSPRVEQDRADQSRS
jgi:hypothetical protein